MKNFGRRSFFFFFLLSGTSLGYFLKGNMESFYFYEKNNEIIAYARIFRPGDYFKEASFGRTVVRKSERGKGVGDELVVICLKNITEKNIEKTIKDLKRLLFLIFVNIFKLNVCF